MTVETAHNIGIAEVCFTEQDEAFLHTIGATVAAYEITCQPQQPDEDDERSGGPTIITHPDHPINRPEEDD